MTTTFKQLGIPDDLNQGIEALGILEPTPVQEQAIPFLMQ
ncbi:MAG: superfamily II DNA/RNA helicase, partial [Lentimonas sp.]